MHYRTVALNRSLYPAPPRRQLRQNPFVASPASQSRLREPLSPCHKWFGDQNHSVHLAFNERVVYIAVIQALTVDFQRCLAPRKVEIRSDGLAEARAEVAEHSA